MWNNIEKYSWQFWTHCKKKAVFYLFLVVRKLVTLTPCPRKIIFIHGILFTLLILPRILTSKWKLNIYATWQWIEEFMNFWVMAVFSHIFASTKQYTRNSNLVIDHHFMVEITAWTWSAKAYPFFSGILQFFHCWAGSRQFCLLLWSFFWAWKLVHIINKK